MRYGSTYEDHFVVLVYCRAPFARSRLIYITWQVVDEDQGWGEMERLRVMDGC
jgi:hypothetical protein